MGIFGLVLYSFRIYTAYWTVMSALYRLIQLQEVICHKLPLRILESYILKGECWIGVLTDTC